MDLILVFYYNPRPNKSNTVWKRNKGIKGKPHESSGTWVIMEVLTVNDTPMEYWGVEVEDRQHHTHTHTHSNSLLAIVVEGPAGPVISSALFHWSRSTSDNGRAMRSKCSPPPPPPPISLPLQHTHTHTHRERPPTETSENSHSHIQSQHRHAHTPSLPHHLPARL